MEEKRNRKLQLWEEKREGKMEKAVKKKRDEAVIKDDVKETKTE